jgi:hypothetical protein
MKLAIALGVAMLLLVATIGIVYAWSFTIDGNPADWGGLPSNPNYSSCDGGVSSTCGTGGFPAQPAEPTIPGDNNIVTATMVMNSTTWYGLIQTDPVSPTVRFDRYTGGYDPYIQVCLDTDNNTTTGATIVNCMGMAGVDRILWLHKNLGTLIVGYSTCASGSCGGESLAAGSAIATANNVVEFSVPLSVLNVNGSCTGSLTVPWAVYFDNQSTPDDDNSPNAGFITFTQPCPTAVNLSNVSATAEPGNSLFAPLTALGLLGVIGGMIVIRRRK